MSRQVKVGSNPEFEKAKQARVDAMPESGSYPAYCFGICIIGTIKESYQGQPAKDSDKVSLIFELSGENYKDANGDIVPTTVQHEMKNSMDPKSNLAKFLSQWSAGKTKKHEGKNTFNLDTMLGKKCMLTVAKIERGEDKPPYLKIEGIAPLNAKMPIEEPLKEHAIFDIEDVVEGKPFDSEALAEWPPFIWDKVEVSKQYISLGLGPIKDLIHPKNDNDEDPQMDQRGSEDVAQEAEAEEDWG